MNILAIGNSFSQDATHYLAGLAAADDGAFSNCPTLVKIHMRREDADTLACSEKLFDGVQESLKIYFYTETSFANFTTGYRWGVFASRMVFVNG